MDQPSTKLYLPITESIRYGWRTVWANLWFFAGVSFVFIIIELFVPVIFQNLVDSLLGIPNTPYTAAYPIRPASSGALLGAIILNLIDIAVVSFMSIYFTRIALLFVDGKKPSLQEIFSYPIIKITLKLLGGIIILYLALFLVPLILLAEENLQKSNTIFVVVSALISLVWLIATTYFAIKYSLFTYPIIDRGEKIFKSFKLSAAMTHKTKLRLIWLGILLVLINIAGALCFIVGLLVTLPMSVIAMAYTYRKILSQVESADHPKPAQN